MDEIIVVDSLEELAEISLLSPPVAEVSIPWTDGVYRLFFIRGMYETEKSEYESLLTMPDSKHKRNKLKSLKTNTIAKLLCKNIQGESIADRTSVRNVIDYVQKFAGLIAQPLWEKALQLSGYTADQISDIEKN